jgi:hypothetical protein
MQVTVHLKGRTECFECQPKATPKSYPVRWQYKCQPFPSRRFLSLPGPHWLRALQPLFS